MRNLPEIPVAPVWPVSPYCPVAPVAPVGPGGPAMTTGSSLSMGPPEKPVGLVAFSVTKSFVKDSTKRLVQLNNQICLACNVFCSQVKYLRIYNCQSSNLSDNICFSKMGH